MTVVASRLRTGSLAFLVNVGDGGIVAYEHGCQASAVALTPAYEQVGSDTETWCGRIVAADVRVRWYLTGTSVSDFAEPFGFVQFAHDHNGEKLVFSWRPNPAAAEWRGTVTVRAVEVGGDVGKRLTVGWAWPLVGAPAQELGPIG